MEPHLPNGTPTSNVPCRYCGCLGANHLKGLFACVGPVEKIPKSVEIPDALMGNLQRGQRVWWNQPSPIIQCPKRCKIYCAPGGIEVVYGNDLLLSKLP